MDLKNGKENTLENLPTSNHTGNNLDLLRLLFASLVLLSHSPELLDGSRDRELLSMLTDGAESFGEFAVNGFFALSGYLVMASWQRHPNLMVYLKNRLFRIYPGFFAAFLISFLVIGPLVTTDVSRYFRQIGVVLPLFSALTLSDPWFVQPFTQLSHHQVNGALWTLIYEFFCYLSVAIIGIFSGKYLKKIWGLLTIILVVAACFLIELSILPPIWHFYPAALIRMSAVFFVGAWLYLIGFKGLKSFIMISLAGLLLGLATFTFRFQHVGFAVFGTLFFLSIGLNWPKIKLTKNWPDISYGTYLYGWPIIQLLIWSHIASEPWLLFALSLSGSLFCGYLSWTFIEAPCLFLKMKMQKKTKI